jgi:hypothetical protein
MMSAFQHFHEVHRNNISADPNLGTETVLDKEHHEGLNSVGVSGDQDSALQ